jgi:hypothetical protein
MTTKKPAKKVTRPATKPATKKMKPAKKVARPTKKATPKATKPTKRPAQKPTKKTASKATKSAVTVTWQEVVPLFGLTAKDPRLDAFLTKIGRANARRTHYIDCKPHGFSIQFSTAEELGRTDLSPKTAVVDYLIFSPYRDPDNGHWRGPLPFDIPESLTREEAIKWGRNSTTGDGVIYFNEFVFEREGVEVTIMFSEHVDGGEVFGVHISAPAKKA